MADRLAGKRVIVTDCNEYAGADIVKLFREEEGEVFAVDRDLTVPGPRTISFGKSSMSIS